MSTYIVDMAPMTVLSRSAAFMAKANFIIENRTDNSITFSKDPTPMGGGMKALMYANVFLNPDTVSQDLTAWNTANSWRATLVVAPTGDGKTEVTVGSDNNGGALLAFWLKNDVLKEENPNPLAEIKAIKQPSTYLTIASWYTQEARSRNGKRALSTCPRSRVSTSRTLVGTTTLP